MWGYGTWDDKMCLDFPAWIQLEKASNCHKAAQTYRFPWGKSLIFHLSNQMKVELRDKESKPHQMPLFF